VTIIHLDRRTGVKQPANFLELAGANCLDE
jgi:hypothetical protein